MRGSLSLQDATSDAMRLHALEIVAVAFDAAAVALIARRLKDVADAFATAGNALTALARTIEEEAEVLSEPAMLFALLPACLLYTSDAADEL